MNEDDMAARQIEPDSPVELESVTEGGNVRRTASGFKARPYNIPRDVRLVGLQDPRRGRQRGRPPLL